MKITFKIGFLIFVLLAALVAINPSGYFERGVLVKSVIQDSAAAEAGITKGEIIKEINGHAISSMNDYTKAVSGLIDFQPIDWTITTDKGEFEYSSLTLLILR